MSGARCVVVMNRAGCDEVRNSAPVQRALLEIGESVASRASGMDGGRYVADVQPGEHRAHCRVKTANRKALNGNARRNTLLKAMGGGQ